MGHHCPGVGARILAVARILGALGDGHCTANKRKIVFKFTEDGSVAALGFQLCYPAEISKKGHFYFNLDTFLLINLSLNSHL